MKKILVFASLLSATQTVYAIKAEPPWLITPPNTPALPTNASVLFTWANTATAQITGYRLVVSTTANFSGYNTKTKACDKSCFTTAIKASKVPFYSMPISNAILKANTNYYWRVDATNSGGTSSSDIHAFSFGAAAPALAPKFLAAIPQIATVSVLPTPVAKGTPLTFSATSDIALPAGYVAKIDYGNNLLMKMDGSGTSYSLTQTPTKLGVQTFNVGIYDNKGVLKSNQKTERFEITAPIPEPAPPVLSLISKVSDISTVGVNGTYSIKLSATDSNGDLQLINIDWLDGSSDSINVAEGETLAITHVYSTAGTFTWTATAYDYADAASNVISQAVNVVAPVEPVVVTPPVTTVITDPPIPVASDYTRIAIDGSENPKSMAKWGCSRSAKSSLLWEVKTDNGYLHDKDWTYSWFEPDMTKNSSYAGSENGGVCKGSKCNTDAYIKAVNAEKLCDKDNWRLPTKKELEGLVKCSASAILTAPPDGLSTTYLENEISNVCADTNPQSSTPFIDTAYFPNTKTDSYWTSDTYVSTLPTYAKDLPLCKPLVKSSGTSATLPRLATIELNCTTKLPVYDSAWSVSFYDSHISPVHKANAVKIRLVSD